MKWFINVMILLIAVFININLHAAGLKTVTENYEDGQVKVKYKVDAKGAKQGDHIEYYKNGKKKLFSKYKNDELHGVSISYYENGKKSLKARYKKGKLDGDWIAYDEKGKKKITTSYRQGKLHSKYTLYKKGKFSSEQNYFNGLLLHPKSLQEIDKTLIEINEAKEKPKKSEEKFSKPRIRALRKLKSYRYICDVDYKHLELNELYNKYSDAACGILNRTGVLTHTPKNPGMSKEDYDFAYFGTTHTNLYEGGGDIVWQVTRYMSDDSNNNVDRVGHRRWCLNPAMNEAGFGRVGNYCAMYAHDAKYNNYDKDFDYVCYPARGYMPVRYFGGTYPWHISLNPQKFRTPAKTDLQITIYTVNGLGKKMKAKTFEEYLDLGEPLELNVNAVDSTMSGGMPAIIFRPGNLAVSVGKKYWVEVKGLTRNDGTKSDISYLVEFSK